MSIDRTVLSELIETIGADAVSRILLVFLDELKTQVSDIRALLDAENLARIAPLAHTIKSTSATFGAEELKGIALEVEMAATNKDRDALLLLVKALEKSVLESRQLYRTYIEQKG